MKRLITGLMCIMFIFCSTFAPIVINISYAFSENKYLRVITKDTPFFKSANDPSPLMYLPYTYYVKLLEQNDNFVHVECYSSSGNPALDGYVPKGVLFKDDLEVNSPYLNKTITTSDTAILYKDSNLTSIIQYVFADREMIYYGFLTTETGNIFLVSYNGNLGYVKESNIMPFTIENHPNELTFIKPEIPEEEDNKNKEETNQDTNFSIKIIIIICLIFAGIIALFAVTNKKGKKAHSPGYYDENDYE